VKVIFNIAALPICDTAPANAGSDSRILVGWSAADLRIGDGVALDAAAIGRSESKPGSRMLLIQDCSPIVGHGRRESCSASKVA
jgi:hypothetical protein